MNGYLLVCASHGVLKHSKQPIEASVPNLLRMCGPAYALFCRTKQGIAIENIQPRADYRFAATRVDRRSKEVEVAFVVAARKASAEIP